MYHHLAQIQAAEKNNSKDMLNVAIYDFLCAIVDNELTEYEIKRISQEIVNSSLN